DDGGERAEHRHPESPEGQAQAVDPLHAIVEERGRHEPTQQERHRHEQRDPQSRAQSNGSLDTIRSARGARAHAASVRRSTRGAKELPRAAPKPGAARPDTSPREALRGAERTMMASTTLQQFRADVIARKSLPTIPPVLTGIIALIDDDRAGAKKLVELI